MATSATIPLPPPAGAAAPGARTATHVLVSPAVLVLIALPLCKFIVHLAVGAGYGYHRDELYYLVCADHLDWGYVDQPPLSVVLLAAVRPFIGSSIAAIRVVPAACGALTVLFIGLMARRLGGGAFAQTIAMVAALVSPFYLSLDGFYSMNAIDLLVWAAAAWLAMRILQDDDVRLWPVLGLVLGLGMQNKIGVLWLCAALVVGLLLTPARAYLKTRGPWIAAAIAMVIALPYALWQTRHHYATVQFILDSTRHKLVPTTTLAFFREQIDGMLPLAMWLWIPGLVFLLASRTARSVRALGWTWLAVFAILAASAGKRGAYLAPAHTWLLAAGGVVAERALSRVGRAGRAIQVALVALLLVVGANGAKYVMPILPEGRLAAYTRPMTALHVAEERGGVGALPEFLSHMTGWPELVATTARAYAQLPPDEQRAAFVLAPNYGDASAVNVLGAPRGLPRAFSGHNNYWIWGPPDDRHTIGIIIGQPEARVREWFADVTHVADTACLYCLPYENHQPVWIARGPRRPFAAFWKELQDFQ